MKHAYVIKLDKQASCWIVIFFCSLMLLSGCDDGYSLPPGSFVSGNPGRILSSPPPMEQNSFTPTPDPLTDLILASAQQDTPAADLHKIDGTLLFSLEARSNYSELVIVDISAPSELELLARHSFKGTPFKLYKQNNLLYALFAPWGISLYNEETGVWDWSVMSHLEVLDVSNPTNIESLASYDIPGTLVNSLLRDGILYVVSVQNTSCHQCNPGPNETITSISISAHGDITVLDQLTSKHVDSYYVMWSRGVTMTPKRIYIAGIVEKGSSSPFVPYRSQVHVFDIADSQGAIKEGTTLEVQGVVYQSWQIHEHQDVLRIISQPSDVWSEAMPELHTYTINSSADMPHLGLTEVVWPTPLKLTWARFDDTRAYLVPIIYNAPSRITIMDLTNPAEPKQIGDIETHGKIVQMEPRQDQLFLITFVNNQIDGSFELSRYDISDPAAISLRGQVRFGGPQTIPTINYLGIVSDLLVDTDAGQLYVTYGGLPEPITGSGAACSHMYGGIHIISANDETLELQGSVPLVGLSSRILSTGDTLFAIGGGEVRALDIADAAQPIVSDTMMMQTFLDQTVVVGNSLVKLTMPGWPHTIRIRLEVMSLTDPLNLYPLEVLELQELLEQHLGCGSAPKLHLFAQGNLLYLVALAPTTDQADASGLIVIVDVSDPTSPTVKGQLQLTPDSGSYIFSQPDSLVAGGQPVVQADELLVLLRLKTVADSEQLEQAAIDVVDLSDAHNPQLASSLTLPEGLGHTQLVVDGTTIITSHWKPIPNEQTEVQFFLDAIALDDPAHPLLLSSYNVPGSVVAYDGALKQALLVDYQLFTDTGVTPDECWQTYKAFAISDTDSASDGNEACQVMKRAIKTVSVSDSGVEVIAETPFEIWRPEGAFYGSDQRMYLKIYAHEDVVNGLGESILVLDATTQGFGNHARYPFANHPDNSYPSAIAADDSHLLLFEYPFYSLVALDAANIDHLQMESGLGTLTAYPYHVTLHDQVAYCSMGLVGLAIISL